MKKSARRMASTSDTGDTSSKQQQAQRKENYNKSIRGPFHQSITAILTEEKREEKQFTKTYTCCRLPVSGPRCVCVHVVSHSTSCHALTCSKGGFTITRHEIRDLMASLMREVCTDVEVEPRLQPLSGEVFLRSSANRDPEAQLDVKARGLSGGTFECAFF